MLLTREQHDRIQMISRHYDPKERWTGPTPPEMECFDAGSGFVLGRCESCTVCRCWGVGEKIHQMSCDACAKCFGCGARSAHGSTIIVAASGAARNTITAACAVFFGINSPYNAVFPPRDSRKHTGQGAELYAVIGALERVQDICTQYCNNHAYLPFGTLVVKTDSVDVVHGMVDQIFTWRASGYWGADGRMMPNADLFQRVDRLIGELYQLFQVQVRF